MNWICGKNSPSIDAGRLARQIVTQGMALATRNLVAAIPGEGK
jgi:hypothetical protein